MRPSIVTWVYFTKFCGASKNSRKVFVILEIFVDFLERNTGYDRISHIMSLPAHNRFDLSTHDITPMPEGVNVSLPTHKIIFWTLVAVTQIIKNTNEIATINHWVCQMAKLLKVKWNEMLENSQN